MSPGYFGQDGTRLDSVGLACSLQNAPLHWWHCYQPRHNLRFEKDNVCFAFLQHVIVHISDVLYELQPADPLSKVHDNYEYIVSERQLSKPREDGRDNITFCKLNNSFFFECE